MTEADWLTSRDLRNMMRLATGRVSLCCGCIWCDNGDDTVSMANGQKCCRQCDNDVPAAGYRPIVSDRKLRLFAVACCRQMWHLLTDPRSRNAVEVAERFADGMATADERELASTEAVECSHENAEQISAMRAAYEACEQDIKQALRWVNSNLGGTSPILDVSVQADLLRKITNNPFRPVTFDRRWLRKWTEDLALNAYLDRDWTTLPILADALEEAGCDSTDILAHLRGPGPHVRGCWALDLILGKE